MPSGLPSPRAGPCSYVWRQTWSHPSRTEGGKKSGGGGPQALGPPSQNKSQPPSPPPVDMGHILEILGNTPTPQLHSVSTPVNVSPCSDLTEQEPGAGANDRGTGPDPQDLGHGRVGMMTRVGCPRLTASSLGQSPDLWYSPPSLV